jgi:hypothetical protein
MGFDHQPLDHGGRLWAVAKDGPGNTFSFRLAIEAEVKCESGRADSVCYR